MWQNNYLTFVLETLEMSMELFKSSAFPLPFGQSVACNLKLWEEERNEMNNPNIVAYFRDHLLLQQPKQPFLKNGK